MNKLINNLPYITKELDEKGLFAYLTRSDTKSKKGIWRIRKYISMYNAPTIWSKMSSDEDKPVLFLKARIFATMKNLIDYFNSYEYVEFCKINKAEPITIVEDDIITEDTFPSYEDLITREYSKIVVKETVSLSDFEKTLNTVTTVKKRKSGKTLSGQFCRILSHPSQVLDVSNFGKTMDRTYGRVLDKIRDREKIEKCTSVDGFQVISNNIQSFERAMRTLGEKYEKYIPLFREAALMKSYVPKKQRIKKIKNACSIPLPPSPIAFSSKNDLDISAFPNVEQYNGEVEICDHMKLE